MIRGMLLLMLLALVFPGRAALAAGFGVVLSPAPVLHTADFRAIFGGASGNQLATDRCGQLRELEFIALPGTVFTLHEAYSSGAATIFRVETLEYTPTAGVQLFVDGRFLELRENAPAQRVRRLPTHVEIMAALQRSVGSSYVWGGNVQGGVPELLTWWYRGLAGGQISRLTLAGLDCTGLLYQATGGWTPRNSSQLITYGRALPVAGKTAAEIAATLQPLDLIVWDGHVVIVLDQTTTIESRLACRAVGSGGVVTAGLLQRLKQIMRTRQPVDAWGSSAATRKRFVVRRWYGLL